MIRRTSKRDAQLTVLASAISAVLFTGNIHAQEQDEESRAAATEEVVVTGTRIRRNDFNSPNAVQTITAEDMENLGLVSVADMLAQMPANVSTYSLDTTGDDAFFVGATMANMRGMNTAFGTRTLTLVDGRRTVSSTNGNGVDMALIPAALVGRMETVTGGAGATYGSDAVAGVVNVVLDRNIENIRIRANYSISDAGDGETYNLSIANGKSLLDGRGQFTWSVEHQTTEPVLDCHTARDWCGRSFHTMNNLGGGDPSAGTPLDQLTELPQALPENVRFPEMNWPATAIVENVRYLHSSPTGSIHSTNEVLTDPTNGQFFKFSTDGRSILPYQTELTGSMREYAYGGASRQIVGGEGELRTENHTLRNGSERNNIYTRFDYDLTDNTHLYAELRYNENRGQNHQNRLGFHGETICIYADNAFISPQYMDQEARDVLEARQLIPQGFSGGCALNPGDFFNFFAAAFLPQVGTNIQKNWIEQLDRGVRTDSDTKQLTLGADGSLFGGDNWTWDAYVSFGWSDRMQVLKNNRTNARNRMAQDSVIDPVTGEAVCRVNASGALGQQTRDTWASYYAGENNQALDQLAAAHARVDVLRAACVPLNPFGLAASPEALAYAYDDLVEFTDSEQLNASVSFSGEVWKGIGAGPLTMATGIDYRDDETDNGVGGDPDPNIRTDFSTQYGDPWVGGNRTSDIFGEFELPLLLNKPAAEYMSINLANRRSRVESYRRDSGDPIDVTRYSDSWKVSWNWSPTDWMRVRTTRSADIRSPAPRELFYRQTSSGGGFFNLTPNPWREFDINGDTWSTVIGSNPNLQNEQSITETVGLIFSPGGFAQGLQFSVDYIETLVKGGISYATGSDPDNEDNLPYPIYRCFQFDDPFYCDQIEFGPPSIEEPNNPRSNILSYTTTQENAEPFWTKAVDLSASYFKRLSGGGSFSVRLLGTHTLEQNICANIVRTSPTLTECMARTNVVGQTGGGGGGNFFTNYTATPDWSGNLFGTYSKNALNFTAQARYIGSGKIGTSQVGPDDPRWGPERYRTTSMNNLPSWTVWNATVNYNLSQSKYSFDRFDNLQVGLTIDNLFDKQPNFYSGGGIGGVNTRFFNGFGRNYRLNMTMEF